MVVGFAGNSVLTHFTALPLAKLFQKFFVDNCQFRFCLTCSVVSDYDLLRHSPVVYVLRDDVSSCVKSSAIGLHSTPYHAFGIEWRWCGEGHCARPRDIQSKQISSSLRIKQTCLRCKWVSASLSPSQLPWLKRWDNMHPTVFTWSHPLTPHQLLSFVNASSDNMEVDK
jgi:hypothetical protein